MKQARTITILTVLIAILAVIYTLITLISSGGPGPQEFTTIHGQVIHTWGYGIYQNMSEDVAPQGLAQDVVTLSVGVPLLLIALIWARRRSTRGTMMLAGVLGYFMVTFIFYLMMSMYHQLFLLLVALAGLSFFAFVLAMMSISGEVQVGAIPVRIPHKFFGGFLVFNAVMITLLWLQVVVPPLWQGTIPPQVQHYTTLVVQALDLAILLPASFVAGVLLYRRHRWGLILGPIYLVFLSLMMAALTAKLIAMASLGQPVIPAIFIIPAFMMVAVVGAIQVIGPMEERQTNP
jgi:hypothetical protein